MVNLFNKMAFLFINSLLALSSLVAHSGGELDVESYLKEVHECIGNKLVDESSVPSYLYKYILNLDASNYIGHDSESKNISLGFSARLGAEEYVLNIYFGLNEEGDCKAISVYEVLN